MDVRTYEGMFMLEPATQEWDNTKKQVIAMVERREGVIISARKWGERKLAYEIKGHKRAAYLLMYFQMPPENINVLRRDLQLSELVMRTLIIVQPKTTSKENQEKENVQETKTEEEANNKEENTQQS